MVQGEVETDGIGRDERDGIASRIGCAKIEQRQTTPNNYPILLTHYLYLPCKLSNNMARDVAWERRKKEIRAKSDIAVGAHFAFNDIKPVIVPPTGEVTIIGLEPEDEWWMFRIVPGSWKGFEDNK